MAEWLQRIDSVPCPDKTCNNHQQYWDILIEDDGEVTEFNDGDCHDDRKDVDNE